MYNDLTNFIPDRLTEETADPSSRFRLDDFVRDAEALKAGFVHDLESQRNLDPSNVLKAKEGVKEIFSGAMQKMKDQAEQIQQEAREQGYQEGHEEGYQAGAQAVRVEYESALEALKKLVTELSLVREQTYSRLEREIVELVTTLARKTIRHAMIEQGEGIRQIVRLAVSQVLDRKALVIRVNPEDRLRLQDFGEDLAQMFPDIQTVQIEPHSGVAPGNCVVETNFGTLEAGLDHLDEHIQQILHLAPSAPPPVTPLEEPEASQTVEPPEPDTAWQSEEPEEEMDAAHTFGEEDTDFEEDIASPPEGFPEEEPLPETDLMDNVEPEEHEEPDTELLLDLGPLPVDEQEDFPETGLTNTPAEFEAEEAGDDEEGGTFEEKPASGIDTDEEVATFEEELAFEEPEVILDEESSEVIEPAGEETEPLSEKPEEDPEMTMDFEDMFPEEDFPDDLDMEPDADSDPEEFFEIDTEPEPPESLDPDDPDLDRGDAP